MQSDAGGAEAATNLPPFCPRWGKAPDEPFAGGVATSLVRGYADGPWGPSTN